MAATELTTPEERQKLKALIDAGHEVNFEHHNGISRMFGRVLEVDLEHKIPQAYLSGRGKSSGIVLANVTIDCFYVVKRVSVMDAVIKPIKRKGIT